MDERAGPILLSIPILIVVVGYLLAWRGKSPKLRKSGNLMMTTIIGLIAVLGSWWALGMTIGIWSLDGRGARPKTTREVLLAVAAEILVFIFPFGALYLCARFAKRALRRDQASSMKKFQE